LIAHKIHLKDAHIERVRIGVCDPQADAVFVETLRESVTTLTTLHMM
jgi:hypothetical protein